MSDEIDLDKPLNKKDLLDYVIKLNERELAKQQRSGLTIWALIAAIGIIGYQVVQLLPLIIKTDNLSVLLLFFITFTNFSLSISRLIIDILDRTFYSKIDNPISSRENISYFLIQTFIIITLSDLNNSDMFQGMHIKPFSYVFFHYTYLFFLFLPTIYSIRMIYYKFHNNIKLTFSDYPYLSTDFLWCFSVPRLIKILFSLTCTFVSGYAICVLDYIYFNEDNYFMMLKASLYIISVLFLVVCLLKEYMKKSTNKLYEEIEKNLVLNNHSYEKTKEFIRVCFIDQSIHNWVSEVNNDTCKKALDYLDLIKKEYEKVKETHDQEDFDKLIEILKNRDLVISDTFNKLIMVQCQSGIYQEEKELLNMSVEAWREVYERHKKLHNEITEMMTNLKDSSRE